MSHSRNNSNNINKDLIEALSTFGPELAIDVRSHQISEFCRFSETTGRFPYYRSTDEFKYIRKMIEKLSTIFLGNILLPYFYMDWLNHAFTSLISEPPQHAVFTRVNGNFMLSYCWCCRYTAPITEHQHGYFLPEKSWFNRCLLFKLWHRTSFNAPCFHVLIQKQSQDETLVFRSHWAGYSNVGTEAFSSDEFSGMILTCEDVPCR